MSTRILLVEPSRTQAQIVAMILADANYDVDTVSTAAAAMEQFAARSIDAVIVNYTLPDETGSSLCSRLKQHHPQTCVLVIAESGRAHQILESLESGADGFCIKTTDMANLCGQVARSLEHARSAQPVVAETVRFRDREYQLSMSAAQWLDVLLATLDDISELKERCLELSGQLAAFRAGSRQDDAEHETAPESVTSAVDQTADVSGPVPSDETTGATVLLAEDSTTNQILGTSLLRNSGYQVLLAANGQEALDHVESSSDQEIAFVLMDVEMPGMDGLEATRRIRARESDSGRRLPILAMTAHLEDDQRQACLDAGMDACLDKPLRIAAVLETLSRTTADTASVAKDEEPLDADAKDTRESPTETDAPSVDWDVALAAVGGEAELLRTVIEAVFEEWPTRKADLHQSIASGDTELLNRTAHSIAGLLRTFQPEQHPDSASDLAYQIEMAAGSSDVAALESMAAQLTDKVGVFISELEAWMQTQS